MTGFHAAFDRALTGDLDALWPHLEPGDRTLGALSVYRNTTIKARIDALEANYPTVLQMVGEDWTHRSGCSGSSGRRPRSGSRIAIRPLTRLLNGGPRLKACWCTARAPRCRRGG